MENVETNETPNNAIREYVQLLIKDELDRREDAQAQARTKREIAEEAEKDAAIRQAFGMPQADQDAGKIRFKDAELKKSLGML